MISLAPRDRDMLIRTIVGEAGNQPDRGKAAVAHAILNRVRAGRYGGKSVSDVVLAPSQFEPWGNPATAEALRSLDPTAPEYRDAAAVADQVLAGQIPDPTGGATHFLNPEIVRKRRGGSLPSWASREITSIGDHAFYAPEGRVAGSAGDITLIGGEQAVAPSRDYAADLLGEGPQGTTASKDWAAEFGLSEPKATKGKVEPAIQARSESDRAADVSDIAVASLANDPQARIRFFAKERGIPEDRYRIVDGEIVYQGDDGNWYREVPDPSLSDPMTILQRSALGVGDAIPAVTGAAAGIASAPLLLTGPAGMAGSMALTGAAAGAGQAGREFLAEQFVGQEPSVERMASEGAAAALGQGIGAGLTAWAQRGAVRDIGRLNRPQMEALQQRGQQQGIPLTPGETSNLTSLKAQQKALGNLPQSSDIMDDFYRARADRIGQRVGQVLDDISPVDSAEVAGRQARGAAEGAISSARASRSATARPLYERVVNPANRVADDAFQPIADDEFLKGIIRRVKDDKLAADELGGLPDNAMPVLDAAKKRIDDMVETARRAGQRNRVRLLQGKLEKLLGVTDDAFPEYPVARAAFAGKSPEVDALEEGVVGIIRSLPDTRLQGAAAKLFDPSLSGPKAVAQARVALKQANPDAWQAIKRSWLQQQWEKAGREFVSTGSQVINQGPKFRALILGDANRRQMLRAALNPKEWKAVNDLAEVLEAAGRVKPVASDTAWNQEMMRVARQEGTPLYAKAARAVRFWDWPKLFEEWATERNMGKNAEALARTITSPGAIERVRELKRLPPASARFRVGLGHLLAQGGFSGVASLLDEGDGVPEIAPPVR